MGRFGRWQGPTEAEQLAAVSHYAKYADYVPVLSASASASAATTSTRADKCAAATLVGADGDGAPDGTGQQRKEPERGKIDGGGRVGACAGAGTRGAGKHHAKGAPAAGVGAELTGSDMSRTSLLGRPLKIETHNRDLRYRKKQNIIYNFLERPRGWKAAIYHFLL